MKKIEFSKKLAVGFTAFYFLVIISAIVLKCYAIDISHIAQIVSIGEGVVLGGYYGKAGYENGKKIAQNVNTEGSEM
jgi:hypothetical protein